MCETGSVKPANVSIIINLMTTDLNFGYGCACAGQTTATDAPLIFCKVCMRDSVGNFGAELPRGSVN